MPCAALEQYKTMLETQWDYWQGKAQEARGYHEDPSWYQMRGDMLLLCACRQCPARNACCRGCLAQAYREHLASGDLMLRRIGELNRDAIQRAEGTRRA